MKIRIITTFLIILALQSCATNDIDVCKAYGDKQFHKAITLKLDDIGFKYSKDKKGLICIKQSQEMKLGGIINKVDQYYRGIAVILTTKKEQETVLSWVENSNIPHHKQNNKKGIFLVIYSLTEEEASNNKFKLDELLHSF